VALLSVDLDLGHHLELDFELVLDGLFDVRVALSLLASELVAREAHDVQAAFFVLVVELLQLTVVFVGEPACAGDVHQDEELLALQGGKGNFVALDVVGLQVPEALWDVVHFVLTLLLQHFENCLSHLDLVVLVYNVEDLGFYTVIFYLLLF
jgi:hypothetical protein